MSLSPKEVAKARLEKYLKSISNLGFEDNPRALENDPEDIRQDDPDDKRLGIVVRSANELVAEHTAKKLVLRHRAGKSVVLFTDEETAEDIAAATAVAVATDPNDINRRIGTWGYTLLIEAAVKGNYEECLRLKNAGADLTLEDNSGKKAWEKARDRGFPKIAKLLKP